MRKIELIAAAAVFAISMPANAQGRGRGNGGVPPGQRPPAGMCRIWIDGVPPGHQPAPTDCATAERRRPANARVIYGDESRTDCRYDDSRNGSTRNGTIRLPDIGGIFGRDDRCVYGRNDDDRRGVYGRDDNDDDDRRGVYRRDGDDDDRSFKKAKKAKKFKHSKK